MYGIKVGAITPRAGWNRKFSGCRARLFQCIADGIQLVTPVYRYSTTAHSSDGLAPQQGRLTSVHGAAEFAVATVGNGEIDTTRGRHSSTPTGDPATTIRASCLIYTYRTAHAARSRFRRSVNSMRHGNSRARSAFLPCVSKRTPNRMANMAAVAKTFTGSHI